MGKYIKNFSSVSDANTQGAAGLYSPHVSIVEGKPAINYAAPAAETFQAEFDDNGYISIPIDLSMVDINGVALSARETSNCYVIKEAGTYKLPLVYGCAITGGAVNAASYTQISGTYTKPFYNYLNNQIVSPYIETDTLAQAASAEVLWNDSPSFTISGIQLSSGEPCRFLKFKVDSVPDLGGNAVLAIKDASGNVMWSWHLWAYPFTLTTKAHKNPNNYTYNMLDVNLGWVKHTADSKYGTSPHFQWGRKDPMVRAATYNSNTQATITGSFRIATTATSLAATIQNPNVFNTYETTHNNWWTDNGTAVDFYNYWDASQTTTGSTDNPIVKTIYDPCPVGFTIPCGNTFLGFTKDKGGTWDNGFTWDGRYFAASGCRYRTSGGLNDLGSYGHCWLASSHSQSDACTLSFGSSYVFPQGNGGRAYGFSVCPVVRPQNL